MLFRNALIALASVVSAKLTPPLPPEAPGVNHGDHTSLDRDEPVELGLRLQVRGGDRLLSALLPAAHACHRLSRVCSSSRQLETTTCTAWELSLPPSGSSLEPTALTGAPRRPSKSCFPRRTLEIHRVLAMRYVYRARAPASAERLT